MDEKFAYMLAHQAQWAEEYKERQKDRKLEKNRIDKNNARIRAGKPPWTGYFQVGRRGFGYLLPDPASQAHCDTSVL